ncbi:MAG: translation elongation factor Ts [Bacilli bacterium]|jgi:elongation factor Ts|nr:translation elongation factor Ts [Bacilli bacterium]MDD3422283.1 translation elongation factor Ts [Bacilli bacterium]MDD4065914.1 translation elongation factor Ts [Bacilli bacterium]
MAITTQMIKELRDRTSAGMMDCKHALEATNGDVDKACDWLREKGIAKAAKKEGRIAAEGLTTVVAAGNKVTVLEVNIETDFAARNEKFKQLVNDLANVLVNSDAKTMDEANKVLLNGIPVSEAIVHATATIGEKISFRRFETITKKEGENIGCYIHMGGKISTAVLIKGGSEEVASNVAMHVAGLAPIFLDQASIDPAYLEKETHVQLEAAKNDPKLAGKPEAMLQNIIKGKVMKEVKEVCLAEQPFVMDNTISVGQYVKNNGGELIKFVRFMVGEGLEHRNEDFAAEVAAQIKA